MTPPPPDRARPPVISARRPASGRRPSWALPGVPGALPLRLRIKAVESLGRLVAGGRSLSEALDDLRQASRDPRLARALSEVAAGLREGALLADAATRAPGLFPPADRGLLEVGERTGRLPEVLARMADSLARRADTRRRIARSAAYPAFLLAMSALTVPLPCLMTSCGLSGYLLRAGSGVALLVGVAALAFFAPAIVARLGLGPALRRLAWTLPGARSLYRPRVRADTLHAAAIALSAGLGVPETLRLAALASADPSAGDACREIARRVDAGSDLASAIGAVDLLPPDDLLSVTGGERGGELDLVLARLAEQALADHARRTDIALKIASWTLLVCVLGSLAFQILGQARNVTGIPDEVLRELERESRGVFQPLR